VNTTVSKRKKSRKSPSSRRPRKKRLPVKYDRRFYPTYETYLEEDPSLADRREWARKVFRVHKNRRSFLHRPGRDATAAPAYEPEDPRFFNLLLDALVDDATTTPSAVAVHGAQFAATARVFLQEVACDDAATVRQVEAACARSVALEARLDECCAQPLRRIGVELLGRYDADNDKDGDAAPAASLQPRDPDAEEEEIKRVRSGAEWQQALLARLFPISDELDEVQKMGQMAGQARGLSRAESAMLGELAHDNKYEEMQPALENKSRDQKSWTVRQYLLLVEDWP
jgi:hypothetical protein